MNTDLYTTTTTSSNLNSEQLLEISMFAGGLAIALVIVTILLFVYSAIALSKIFKKAGIKGWIAWVPFYNTWKFFELGNFNGALSLLPLAFFIIGLIPIIGFIGSFAVAAFGVLAVLATNNIGKGFGKKETFTVLAFLLPFVWLGILAFGKDKWSGKMYQKVSTAVTPPAAPTPPTSTNS